jgi:hypothetical protein
MELKPIRSIDKKNMKVTFYLSETLYSQYKNIQKKAKELGYKVDFSNDFTTWFSRQLQEAEVAINNIRKK